MHSAYPPISVSPSLPGGARRVDRVYVRIFFVWHLQGLISDKIILLTSLVMQYYHIVLYLCRARMSGYSRIVFFCRLLCLQTNKVTPVLPDFSADFVVCFREKAFSIQIYYKANEVQKETSRHLYQV